jgi:outer membrane receptor protein involved in Fe transport
MNPFALGLSRSRLSVVISGILAPVAAFGPATGHAQDGPTELLVVTATRRSNTVQDIPLNVTAVSGQTIDDLQLDSLDEIARLVPGLAISEIGPRDEFPNIIVRGLNTSNVGPLFPRSVSVATYLGEIPLQADFRTHDLERVEVLIGPQGTLYGSGTLGGTIRYLPARPDAEGFEAEVRGRAYDVAEAGDPGMEYGFTINAPIVDESLAFRVSVDYLDDPGFIDYPWIVQEAGVSNPQPDFSDPSAVAANLRRTEDADFAEVLSGRMALRWMPTDAIDATLTFHYQDVETGGRTLASVESIGTGRYESGYRFDEPMDNRNDLLSLEIVADLGFAELTSATGKTKYSERGQRDQTDLLLNFEYYYETFPFFSAFTRDLDDEESIVQELRLVSTGAGKLSWIGGIFYSDFEANQSSHEYVPGFDQWAVDNLGGVQLRPDALEYIEISNEELIEQALYGEISYPIGNDWQLTLGARLYEFEATAASGFGTPLFDTVFDGAPPDSLDVGIGSNDTDDSGSLFKINLSHYFNNDILGYVTISEGYRVGGVNPVAACTPEDLGDPSQALCALPEEELVKPDRTTNYEVGVHSTLLDGSLYLNADVYHIDWEDIQVGDVTLYGSLPITSNGSSADSDGVEISAQWRIGDRWQLNGIYAYTRAELAEGTDAILGGRETGPLFTPAGSRLPGSPEHQASLGVGYSMDIGNGLGLDIGYNISYMGDVLTNIGAGEEPSVEPWHGEKLPGYSLHQLTVKLSKGQWAATFFVDNLLDEYYLTSVRESQRLLEVNRDYLSAPTNTNGFLLRNYARYIGTPRTIGFGFSYGF